MVAINIDKVLCNKCKSEMDKLEEDYESMTEGQMADYDAGLWGTFWCPSCKISKVIEGQFSQIDISDEDEYFEEPTFLKLVNEKQEFIVLKPREKLAKENIIRGDFNEYLARKCYEFKEYTVIKLVNQVSLSGGLGENIFNEKELKKYCEINKLKRLYKFLISQPIAGLPDFICIKNREFFFVECKCNPEKFKETQIERFQSFRKKKYPIKIFCTTIDLLLNYKKSIISDLA